MKISIDFDQSEIAKMLTSTLSKRSVQQAFICELKDVVDSALVAQISSHLDIIVGNKEFEDKIIETINNRIEKHIEAFTVEYSRYMVRSTISDKEKNVQIVSAIK